MGILTLNMSFIKVLYILRLSFVKDFKTEYKKETQQFFKSVGFIVLICREIVFVTFNEAICL